MSNRDEVKQNKNLHKQWRSVKPPPAGCTCWLIIINDRRDGDKHRVGQATGQVNPNCPIHGR